MCCWTVCCTRHLNIVSNVIPRFLGVVLDFYDFQEAEIDSFDNETSHATYKPSSEHSEPDVFPYTLFNRLAVKGSRAQLKYTVYNFIAFPRLGWCRCGDDSAQVAEQRTDRFQSLSLVNRGGGSGLIRILKKESVRDHKTAAWRTQRSLTGWDAVEASRQVSDS